jgi:tetratricopeptide (TPR) repeat protein
VSNPVEEGSRRSAAAWLDAVIAEERRGELLTAFDLAERALDEHPDDRALQHRAVLALARAGSTDLAAQRFERYGLDADASEDVRALGARIAKDRALAAPGEERRRLALRSAALYDAIFADTRGYSPGVNAATLRLLGGDAGGAEVRARQVLEILRGAGDDSYYAVATEAEAQLLLGDVDAAGEALERAAALHEGDYAATATTRRQLRLVCAELGIDPAVLAPLAGPRVVHYCGHRLTPPGAEGPFPAEALERVEGAIGAEVELLRPSFAYGALASGADILWAEALLDRGAELHVVLPFARDEFVRASVADAGTAWVERFDRCLAAATDVGYATDDAFLSDDVLYRYGSELAMGLALLRSRFLDAEAHQLAVWDGLPARGEAGTAIDVATWSRGGRAASIVRPDGGSAPVSAPAGAVADRDGPEAGRVVRALLFADVHGFSKLRDEQYPRFADLVLGTFAEVLHRHDEHVCFRNTWGDGLYVVLTDPLAAAACALELQDAMTAVHPAEHSLPGHLALRLGGHLGPVFPTRDPVLGTDAFMGSHVSRTARIEPVTPAGTVYVTEAFAAALELADDRFASDYVGHMPAAKDFGRLRMYRLRER